MLAGRDGGAFAFGAAPFAGSAAGLRLAQPVVGAAATPSGRGYWLAARDGGVFGFDAPFRGSAGGMPLNAPVVGIAGAHSGQGYWLVAADGGVFAFGDAPFLGSMGGSALARPVVGIAATPSGRGYWLAAADGGVFAFGDAPFLGSVGSTGAPSPRPVVGIAPRPQGDGYWLAADDGRVLPFGAAAFHGRAGGSGLAAPVVGIAGSPSGSGYWLAAADGGVFALGDAPFAGSLGGVRLNAPVAAVAAAPRPAPPEVAIFYYPWYATPGTDGLWRHWEQNGHQPPDDIGADYYPQRGTYSNADPGILEAHMAEIRETGVGEVVSSWWGRGSYEDERLPAVAAAARRHGLELGIILEPYPGRTPPAAAGDIAYLRTLGARDVFVYESLGEDVGAWAAANARKGDVRVLGHSSDTTAVRSGLMVVRARQAGFDGVFTYDPSGYAPSDFGGICAHARALSLACVPSVSPGFEAGRATGNTAVRPRRGGAAYDEAWQGAVDAAPTMVAVTSYNEWHEGTQIEPARPRSCLPGGYCYSDYEGAFGRTGGEAAAAYLDRTALWAARVRQ